MSHMTKDRDKKLQGENRENYFSRKLSWGKQCSQAKGTRQAKE